MTSTVWSRKTPYGYTKMDIEDPEDVQHRRAQFLIYKVLQQVAESPKRRRRWWWDGRLFRLKIKIGKRLRKLKKGVCFRLSAANCGGRKQVGISPFKSLKRMFGVRDVIASTTPVFA